MAKSKILVVEDERIVAEDIKRILEKLGYTVTSIISSGREAVKNARKDNPDLILMDIVLKGTMDGIEAAGRIRARLNIPVVYLTAYADKKTLQRAKITEPYGYILKPFSERELHASVEVALYKRQMEKRIEHLNTVLRAIRNVNQLITREKNRDKLLQGICDNLIETRGYHEAWVVIIDESGKFVTTLEAGFDNGFEQMADLLKHGDLPECSKKALMQSEVLIIENVSETCTNCPLFEKHVTKGALITRLESDEKIYGLLIVTLEHNFVKDEDEISLFNEVAADVALGLHTIKIEEERKQAVNELQESEARLRNIIKRNADAIIIIDKNGIVRFVNPAAEVLFGRCKKEILNESFGFPVIADETTEIDIIQKNREKIIAEMRIVDMDWQGKTAYLASLRDITNHKNTEQALQQSLEKSQRILQETVRALAIALEKRDPYTAGHSWRVAQLAFAIAKEIGMPEEQITCVHMAAAIHDIGKIYIPAEILSKPTRLTEGEFMIVKTHCQVGFDILENIEFPWPIAKIVFQHHERINGSGYPKGLKDGDILREAKILGVADVVEAMCSHRPYRPAPGLNKALAEIKKNKGVLYNPDVADACLKLFKEKGFKFE